MYNLYTVKDLVSQTSIKPMAFLTDRDAIDGFKFAVNEPETPYNKHPQDYVLVKIGSYDERTSNVGLLVHKQIALANDLLIKKENKND